MSASSSSSSSNQAPASPWVLFGLDLSTVGQDWLHAMRQLYRLPPLRWFELNPRIQLLRANGSTTQWQANQLQTAFTATGSTEASLGLWAVELPESLILRRELTLPDLPEAQIKDAVALDLMSSSPFQADDVAWGFTQEATDTGIHIHSVFASRAQIAQYLDNAATAQSWNSDRSEVWAFAPQTTQPIVLQGFGEAIAERARNARRLKTGVALALLTALLAAVAVTPTLQVRHQALQAESAYKSLMAQTTAATQERAVFTKALESVAQIKQYREQRINPLAVFELLSETLPKDVSATTLKIEGQSVELTAEADNAAAIIQKLSEMPEFAEVRTTRPVQQVPRANKERFTVEMTVAPGAFDVNYAEEEPAPAVPAEDTPPPNDTVTPTAPEPVPPTPTPAPAEPAPPQLSQPSAAPPTMQPAPSGGASSTRRRRDDSNATSGVAPSPSAPQPLRETPAGPPPPTPVEEVADTVAAPEEHVEDDAMTTEEEVQ